MIFLKSAKFFGYKLVELILNVTGCCLLLDEILKFMAFCVSSVHIFLGEVKLVLKDIICSS